MRTADRTLGTVTGQPFYAYMAGWDRGTRDRWLWDARQAEKGSRLRKLYVQQARDDHRRMMRNLRQMRAQQRESLCAA